MKSKQVEELLNLYEIISSYSVDDDISNFKNTANKFLNICIELSTITDDNELRNSCNLTSQNLSYTLGKEMFYAEFEYEKYLKSKLKRKTKDEYKRRFASAISRIKNDIFSLYDHLKHK